MQSLKHLKANMTNRKRELLPGRGIHRRTESDYMGVLLDAVSLDEWRDVVCEALKRARQGDDMRQIDIRRLAREGYLRTGLVYGWQWIQHGEVVASINAMVETDTVWLAYRQRQRGGQWHDLSYPVCLDRTACHLGGQRLWWRCPVVNCGRRVAVLYGGRVFACRHCHRLAYKCQRESDTDRAMRRAETLRNRLGWEPGILNGESVKPKGMRWQTYERLLTRYEVESQTAISRMAARLGFRMG